MGRARYYPDVLVLVKSTIYSSKQGLTLSPCSLSPTRKRDELYFSLIRRLCWFGSEGHQFGLARMVTVAKIAVRATGYETHHKR